MALAATSDVEARLGRPLETTEVARVEALLDDASAAVIGYCRQDFAVPPVPTAVAGVVAKMAARALQSAAGTGGGFIQNQTAGPFGVQFSAAATTGDVWMTAADKLALRPHRLGGGLTSVQFVGERYEITP